MKRNKSRKQNGQFTYDINQKLLPVKLFFLSGAFVFGVTIPFDSFKLLPVEAKTGETDRSEARMATQSSLIVAEPLSVPPVLTEKQEVINYIVEVFGEDAPDAFNVLFCENRNLNPEAVNHNRNGSRDLGIFQLNDRYWGGEENFNWKTNIDKAKTIFDKQGWKPWTCSGRVNQKNYMEK